ncbi:DsbA family protein [Terriglobus aquaticus]|uniref:DsbA family protein n=1 Tax=Terriglobus aquaticus TaxID=940139 RepID=A0ABW9KND2_9BACT|nr:DsbA family protein [Terriglobus aquaticus]
MNRRFAAALVAGALSLPFAAAHAQILGPASDGHFKDTSMLKPPAGQRVAVVVFEDLECPACAAAHPIELQAAQQYHVPIVRYDFPLQMHVWSFEAAVFARYLQDKVNPALADEYRTQVFRNQISIASKDDLQNFTKQFMQKHGQAMPFVVDPGGKLAGEVKADYGVGLRLNVTRTPTIFVVENNGHYETISGNETGGADPNRLFPVIDAALKQTHNSAPAAVHTVARTTHK